jgi:hypothetical protein
MKKIMQISAIIIFAVLFTFSCSDDSDTVKKNITSLPTVTTGAVTSITMTGAMVAGEVTSDGNATVTERGICWGLDTLPTASDDKELSGAGTGVYSITIVALTEATKYHARAYAINSEGLTYGVSKSFTTKKGIVKKYNLGEMFEGGVIYHINDDSTHGLAFADTALGKMAWGCHGTAITGAVGFNIGDGAQNTADIIKECKENDCAANFVTGLSHGGYTGWHLPSRDELLTLHTNWISTGKGKITKGVYWASNQNRNNKSDMAQIVDVGIRGIVAYEQKKFFAAIRVVAVKEF